MTKICPCCREEKEFTEFYEDKTKKDGKNSYCILCNKETSKKRRDENTIKNNATPDTDKIEKRCYGCKEFKPINMFTTKKSSSDGKSDLCISCDAISKKVSRKKNVEKNKLNPITDLTTPKKCSKCSAQLTIGDFYKDATKSDGFQRICKPCKNLRDKQYASTHKEQIRRNQRNWMNKKHAEDLSFKLDANLRSALTQDLKERDICKNKRTIELVGYSGEEFNAHMESLFTEGMTRDNYGRGPDKWNIGHRIAVCRFSYTSYDDPQFKICWGLDNLFPQWEVDNKIQLKEDRKLSVRRKEKI